MKTKNAPMHPDLAPVPGVQQMAANDPMPEGPYRLGLTEYPGGRLGPPWVIRAANGQCVAGWIDAHQCAVGIVSALNLQFPV